MLKDQYSHVKASYFSFVSCRARKELEELKAMRNDAVIAKEASKSQLEREEQQVYHDRKKREVELSKVRKEAEEKKMLQEQRERRLVRKMIEFEFTTACVTY